MTRAQPKVESDPTRERLLEAACSVFSETGFRAATVRDICARAGVNVAAVNYHFGDKLGLYTDVLSNSSGAAAQDKIRAAVSISKSPEEALRAFVRGMLEKMFEPDRPGWHFRIMIQELANPTPALATVVDHLIRPQYEQLCGVVGSILSKSPKHRITRLCVHSLIGQVTHYAHGRAVIRHLWPELEMTVPQRNEVADHIVRFTLSGLKGAMATATHGERKTGPRPAASRQPTKKKRVRK